MKAKKLLKILGIILIFLIILFLIHSFRNFIIISKLQNKISEYLDSDNYHIHMVSKQNEQLTVTTDYYKKGNKQALFIERNKNEEVSKLSFYDNGERTDMFTETPTEKIAKIDTETNLAPIVVVNALQAENNWQIFLYGSISRVKSIKYNDKECYEIINYLSPYYLFSYDEKSPIYIIDKETGLLLKNGSKDMVVEREHEFNNVDDSIFIEPDIGQYTIKY